MIRSFFGHNSRNLTSILLYSTSEFFPFSAHFCKNLKKQKLLKNSFALHFINFLRQRILSFRPNLFSSKGFIKSSFIRSHQITRISSQSMTEPIPEFSSKCQVFLYVHRLMNAIRRYFFLYRFISLSIH